MSTSQNALDQFVRMLHLSNPGLQLSITTPEQNASQRILKLEARQLNLAILLLGLPYGLYVLSVSPKLMPERTTASIRVKLF